MDHKSQHRLLIGIGIIVFCLPEVWLIRNWLTAEFSQDADFWRIFSILYLVVVGGIILAALLMGSGDDYALKEHRRKTHHIIINKQAFLFSGPQSTLTDNEKNVKEFLRVHNLQQGTRVIVAGGLICLIVLIMILYNKLVSEIDSWDWVNALGGFSLFGIFIYFIASFSEWIRMKSLKKTNKS
jgi:uncharacterized integral membrane protein